MSSYKSNVGRDTVLSNDAGYAPGKPLRCFPAIPCVPTFLKEVSFTKVCIFTTLTVLSKLNVGTVAITYLRTEIGVPATHTDHDFWRKKGTKDQIDVATSHINWSVIFFPNM